MRRLALAAFALLLGACDFGTLDDLSQDQATQGGDELTVQARKLWDVYDVTKYTDADVRKAIADVEGVVARNGSSLQVKINGLTKDDLALIGKGDNDPANAQGMLLVNELDCSLADLEKLLVAKNQSALYPGLYDAYTRDYTTSIDDYFARTAPSVTWQTTYTASALDRTYNGNVTGGSRYVASGLPSGAPVILARTFLDAPAVFTKGTDSGFDQDYQIELYYETAPGKTLHLYALWRDFHVTTLTSQSDLYINVVLGNLKDFDVRTSKICRDKAPVATFQ
jgi:hypothetical protein